LSNGSYTATPSKGGYTFSPTSHSITLSGSNSTGQNFTGSVSGSVDVAAQIYADMGTNEAHPHGVPSSYDFYTGAFIGVGNSIAPNTALEWWGGLYVGPSGNPASNSLVNVRHCALYTLSTGGAWTTHAFTFSDISSDFYSEDWVTDYGTSVSMRLETDGSFSFRTISGKVAHFYAPYPRVGITPSAIAGVVAYCEARLILENSGGTDDRGSAAFLLDCGADPYLTTTSGGAENINPVGLGRFKYVGTNWRSFAMTSCTLAQLQANPPPITLTGILP
jgi:hypothetical protein